MSRKIFGDDSSEAADSLARLVEVCVAQGKLDDAEPLLLSGYEELKQSETRMPAATKPRIRQALVGLVQLYDAMKKPEKAAEWRQKLGVFDSEKKTEPH